MSSDNCLRCHWSVRLQSYLSIPGLIVSLELEVSFEAGCLLQHLRLAAVDQFGLKVGVSVLLCCCWWCCGFSSWVRYHFSCSNWTGIWFHLFSHTVHHISVQWLQLKDPHGAEERAGHQLLEVPCLGQLLKLLPA